MNAHSNIAEKVRKALLKELADWSSKRAVSAMKETDKPYEVLSLCSIEVADILLTMEERFRVSLPNSLYENFKSMTLACIIQEIVSEIVKDRISHAVRAQEPAQD